MDVAQAEAQPVKDPEEEKDWLEVAEEEKHTVAVAQGVEEGHTEAVEEAEVVGVPVRLPVALPVPEAVAEEEVVGVVEAEKLEEAH